MTELYHFDQPSLFGLPKECTSCHIVKPLDEFYKQSPRRGGYQAWCIACWNERRRLKRLQNIEHPPEREQLTSQVCKRCAVEKPIDAFYADITSERGYKAACKDCVDRVDKRRKNPGKRRNQRGVPISPDYKWCYRCESEKSLTEFREDKTKWDGRCPRCNDCWKVYNHTHWQENREELLPVQRIRSRNLYNSNLEYYRAKGRKKSKLPQYQLIAIKAYTRRRARKLEATIGDVDYQRILKRDGYHCYICDKDIDPTLKKCPGSLVFDHVKPLAGKGENKGTHSEDNIKPVHRVCNERKNVRLLSEMTPFQRRGPDA